MSGSLFNMALFVAWRRARQSGDMAAKADNLQDLAVNEARSGTM
jgi:hypothetical protein